MSDPEALLPGFVYHPEKKCYKKGKTEVFFRQRVDSILCDLLEDGLGGVWGEGPSAAIALERALAAREQLRNITDGNKERRCPTKH